MLCYAGESRGQGLGMHTASTSSLQHEEGVNGVNGVGALPHPGYVRTASVADSGDEAAHTVGVLLAVIHTSHVHAYHDAIDGQHGNELSSS